MKSDIANNIDKVKIIKKIKSSYKRKTKPCRYCSSYIPEEAQICSVCKSYQSPIRNNLFVAAGLTGLITVFGSALIFSLEKYVTVKKELTWKDQLELLDFKTYPAGGYRVLFSNVGDGQLFINDITIFMNRGKYPSSLYFDLNKTIESSKIEMIEVEPEKSDIPLSYDYLDNQTGLPSEKLLLEAKFVQPSNRKECLHTAFFSNYSNDLARMKQHYIKNGTKIIEHNSEMEVSYYSLKTRKSLKSRFPATALFTNFHSEECREAANGMK